jgi:hypothetical protein
VKDAAKNEAEMLKQVQEELANVKDAAIKEAEKHQEELANVKQAAKKEVEKKIKKQFQEEIARKMAEERENIRNNVKQMIDGGGEFSVEDILQCF